MMVTVVQVQVKVDGARDADEAVGKAPCNLRPFCITSSAGYYQRRLGTPLGGREEAAREEVLEVWFEESLMHTAALD